jgi:hypothetical protein
MTKRWRTTAMPLTVAAALLLGACDSGAGPSSTAQVSNRPPDSVPHASFAMRTPAAPTPTPAPPAPTPEVAVSPRPSATASPNGASPRVSVPSTASALPTKGANSYEHIFLVLFENHGYSQIVGRAAAPNFNRLIKLGALSTAYRAIGHPSLPNYLALVGGSTFGVRTDCSPATCPVSASNLGSLLSAHGRTWKAYMESMPSTCGTRNTGSYAVRHDPFVYFNNIRTTSLCRNVVPYTQLATDLGSNATTPRFAFVTPNVCHDMHDCSIATGDAWLGAFAARVMKSPAWLSHRSLLLVAFDEDNGAEGNRVVAFAVGSPIRKSVVAGRRSSTTYNHYNLLRTIEYYLGVPALGRNDSGRAIMTALIPN